MRVDGDRVNVTTFEEHRRCPTDLGIGLLDVVFGTVVSGSDVSTDHVHRRRDHGVRIVDFLEDLHPASLDRIIDRQCSIRIVRWRQLLVYPRRQEENNIVFSDASFEQVDGVVALEGDEQIRIDDVCLHVRKERVRHVDSLPATVVDRRVQLVNVGARFEIGIDIQEHVAQFL